MTDETRDWTPEEAAALRKLAAAPPPAGLEDEVVAALADHGLVREQPAAPHRRLWVAWILPPTAAVALLVAIWAIGSREPGARDPGARDPGTPAPGTRYALLFYEGPGFDTPTTPEAFGSLAAEYGAWAEARRAEGIGVTGEELAPRGRSLSEGAETAATREGEEYLGGFMIVEAASLEAAVELARGHPHLAHGGRIVVRPVVDH